MKKITDEETLKSIRGGTKECKGEIKGMRRGLSIKKNQKSNTTNSLDNQIEVLKIRKEEKKYQLDRAQREYDDIAKELNELEAKQLSSKKGYTIDF